MTEGSPTTPKTATSQQLFFRIILSNMKNKPDIDWAVVAEKAGYNSGNTARDRFHQIMSKLSGEGGRNSSKTTSSTGLSEITESQIRPAKPSFPSRVTKSKSVSKKKRMVKAERHSESSAENEQRFEGGQNSS